MHIFPLNSAKITTNQQKITFLIFIDLRLVRPNNSRGRLFYLVDYDKTKYIFRRTKCSGTRRADFAIITRLRTAYSTSSDGIRGSTGAFVRSAPGRRGRHRHRQELCISYPDHRNTLPWASEDTDQHLYNHAARAANQQGHSVFG